MCQQSKKNQNSIQAQACNSMLFLGFKSVIVEFVTHIHGALLQ